MTRIALTFVIIAIGCVVVGYVITKIIAAIIKLKDDFEKEDRK
jgi:hypothetical protein